MADPIARVESFHLAIPSVYGGPQPPRDAQWPHIELVLVRLETVAGVVGWGEAFGHRACATTHAAITTLIAPLAVGLDSAEISGVGAQLRRGLHAYGLGGPVGFGLSGIDIALWDIAGKRAGLPVRRLLNPASTSIEAPAYASLLRYGDAGTAAEAAADAVARGHHAVKLHEATVESVFAAREAVGPKIRLSLDVNCRWSVDDAMDMAQRLAPAGLEWIEEPCWPADPETLSRVSMASKTPIAAGENADSLDALERLATIGKATYLQPSATKLGGLSALLAARDATTRLARRIAPHSAYFGPGLAATLHFCVAFGLDCEWYDCRLECSPSGLFPDHGALHPPDHAGLGASVDDDLIGAYRVTP